jgi:ankyrin repeat protein
LDKDPALLNSYSTDGYTPIALACFFNHEPLVRLLADRGADVNAASRDGHQRAPIHAAASGGSAAILEILLKHGADPDARQEMGFTAAHSAAANGNVEMLRLLAEHGADLQARSEKGEKPLDFAQRQNRAEAVKFLEELK